LCGVVLPSPKCFLHLGWHSSIYMSTIYYPNTVLREFPTNAYFKICTQVCILQIAWHIDYLKVWIPFWAVTYLKWCVIIWNFYHDLSKFPNNIQDLLEMSMHYFYGSFPDLVNNSKVLVMANNIVDGLKTYPSTICKRTDPTPFSPRDSQGSCQSAEQGDYKRSIYFYALATKTLLLLY
jgi:hypothetical protein